MVLLDTVPSSQPDEWELVLPDTTVHCDEEPSSTQDRDAEESVADHSPRVVRTSQSVAEEELNAAWIAFIAENLAALRTMRYVVIIICA